ncbi:hypothetical protein [Streptomyces tauricus]|uniref:hypothetical protein n=1 Tax=Streptomyces tauricus TaxID=68274 RepID=UPI001676223F|nr:hypothetical protein [Streptomyces tauricus]
MFTKPCDHGLGRSHGGFTTRPYLLVEQSQQPTSILATARQHGDSLQFETVLEKDSLPRAAPPRPAEPAAAAGVDSVSCWSTEVTMALHSAGPQPGHRTGRRCAAHTDGGGSFGTADHFRMKVVVGLGSWVLCRQIPLGVR